MLGKFLLASAMARSIRVAPECIPLVKQALRRRGFPSQNALGIELGLSRSTITSFFTGKPVYFINFIEISERLGLDWQAIAYIEQEPATEVQLSSKEPQPNSEATQQQRQSQEIDWRQVGRTMLEAQHNRRLTTNPLTTGDGVTFELDEIYVPLGLVQRKQQHRVGGDVSPEQGSKVYELETEDEIVQTFQNEQFFEQVLRPGRSQRIAIIGEPGAGKTTLLQKIAAWVLDNTSDVPIWVSLADLHRKSLKEYLLCDWLEAASGKVRVTEEMQDTLGELFNSGRVWLLLDAVDEMAVEQQSLTPLQLIAHQLIGWIADARVVLTCRLNIWDAGKNALEAFESYRNLDFSYGDVQTSDQVGQFINRWFKSRPELAERLRAELDQPGRERIKDAVKNPLRLALLCRSWMLGQGVLPNTKARLYQLFTESLYEWKQDRFPTSSTQRQELNQALGKLALRAIASEKTRFRLRHHLVLSVLGKPDEELFQLALQLGWLNQVGVAAEAENLGEKVYAFYHPTFQEYFAAQAVKDWHYFLNHVPDNPAQGTYRIFEPQWKEIILLWLGREDVSYKQKEAFIKTLLMFEDVGKIFYSYRAYFLAAAGIAEFRDCSWADVIVAQIVRWSFGYFDTKKHAWRTFVEPDAEVARAVLRETDRTKASTALIELLHTSQEQQICWQAFEELGKIDPYNPTVIAAITSLVELIKSTGDESARSKMINILGKMGSGNQTAITALVELIKSTGDESTCSEAIEILGRIGYGNQTAITALVQLIESTKDKFILDEAIYSLGKIGFGNQIAIQALLQLIDLNENEYICLLAAITLGKIDTTYQIPVVTLTQTLELAKDKEILLEVIASLEKLGYGTQAYIAVLVQILESTEDEYIRWKIADYLVKVDPNNELAITVLVQLVELSNEEYTRWYANSTLEEIGTGNELVIGELVRIINSNDNEYAQLQAARILGKIDVGNQTAIAALVEIIESTGNSFIRYEAAHSMGEIGFGNQTIIATLSRLIESIENEYVCWKVAESLGKIDMDNSTAIAELVQLFELTKEKSIIRLAAESLKKILRNEQFVEIIIVLKKYLSLALYQYDIERFYVCYQLIWHCTQNMTYPDFYQAWHTQSIPPLSKRH